MRLVSAVAELALVLGGAYLYYRSATGLPSAQGSQRRRALAASGVTTALLLLASDVLGL